MSISPKKRVARAQARAAEALGHGEYSPLSVAMVGRPNVGKSTLFNRLAGANIAIINRIPGTTRDWKQAPGKLGPLPLEIVDTGGLEMAPHPESLEARMQRLTAAAVEHAEAVMFMVDATQGITAEDRHFAKWLHKHRAGPVFLVANKSEKFLSVPDEIDDAWLEFSAECWELGLGEPIPVSAEHGDGMVTLCEALLTCAHIREAPRPVPKTEAEVDAAVPEGIPKNALNLTQKVKAAGEVHVAIVGRPNVGKSTLMNTVLSDERTLTGPTPGVTRDAISVDWEYDGRPMCLIDTAGMRRWGSWDLSTPLEAVSVANAKKALGKAHVVVLVIDATIGLTKQDLTITQQVLEEGRALVVVLNKIDQCEVPRKLHRMMEEALEDIAVDARGVECVSMSALTGKNVGALMPAVLQVYDKWNVRVSTSLLNRWLWRLSQVHPPPAARKTVVVRGAGRDKGQATKSLRLKLKYLTQINIRPPTFALFANRPDVPESYRRFLVTALRTEFGLDGVPIRLVCRASHNPFNARPSKGQAVGRMAKTGSSRSKKKYGGTKSSRIDRSPVSAGMRKQLRLRRVASDQARKKQAKKQA